MTEALLRLAAFGAPAMLGVLSAIVGRKSVQALREQRRQRRDPHPERSGVFASEVISR